MKIVIIGAAGKVGRRIAVAAIARGDEVTGLHRSPLQSDAVAQTGAVPYLGDLTRLTVNELATVISGHDAVVFTAGAHGTGIEQDTLIDGLGLAHSADATVAAGVKTFILVSVFPEAVRDRVVSEGFQHHLAVKKRSEVHVAATPLDWLIVRPGKLTDEPGTGLVTAAAAAEYGSIPRDDVAEFIVRALHSNGFRRTVVEVTAGPTPISEAIEKLSERTL